MEQILSVLKYLATSNAINFIIMLTLLGWILRKINLGKSISESIESIKSKIIESETNLTNAKDKLSKSQKRLKQMPKEISELEKNAQNKIEAFKAQIEENTQNTIFKLEKNIDKILETEETKISNILTNKTTAASVKLAKQHFIKALKDNPELHNQFIQDSLDELDKVEL